ncbi:hypothetical protein Btru_023426 [Bulinus truncatus]|nr:hypothetical protein Btru_023426 [Bulinus truncatus]
MRNLQGFQIAKLYVDIKEYTTAKKYLSAFFRAREDVPQAHQLMGDINVALAKKDEAIDNYKRALSLSGGFITSNRLLVKKICELYCELAADVQEMKFWLDKCETLCPKDDVIFKLKVKISESVNGHDASNNGTKENLIASELVNQPTNMALRIKLLNVYLESGKYEEAYENAVKTDLTTAFMDQLQWFETLITVFQEYGSKNADAQSDSDFNQHLLHILRNLTYLSLWKKDVSECAHVLTRFDKQLKKSSNLTNQDESWIAMLKEMKGQLFFLSALLLLKKAQNGLLKWQEANHLAGACFLASRSVGPLDAQAPWFVTAPQDQSKFYNWWHLQSYDRLSQVGHMLLRLSQGELMDWTRTIKQQVMTALGHQKVFKAVFSPRDLKEQGEVSFFYKVTELSDSSDLKEPLTERHMLDVDRVAYQVHLNDLSHLVWLCLQRYSPDKDAQPNYHFNILENIQYSVKNLENAGAETLCQLDILVFLLATVKCAVSSMTENKYLYDDHSGQPSLLPVCLTKPLCTQDQNEWWTAAYKFCTNTVKVLIRGIETVRLIGSHGVSVSMTAHIARSLDAKVASLKKAEYGCRCPASELTALESRAAYYWQKVKHMLEKFQRNQYSPVPKNRLFKEVGDGDADLPPRLIDKLTAEANFALALVAMSNGQYEEALESFATHRSPWAKYHSAQIFKILSDQEDQSDGSEEECSPKKQALLLKARDCLYDVMDRLSGDKSHPLNVFVSRDLDDIEAHIHGFEYEDRDASSTGSFHTPAKYPAEVRSTPGAKGLVHSTPRSTIPLSFAENGVDSGKGLAEPTNGRRDFNVSSTSDHYDRPRPSPERLDSQIRSLSYSQNSLFKMVLDRNEELIVINGKMMEELRDNNVQLRSVLTENKALMEELKNFLVENRDMMKEIKADFNAMKASMSVPTPPIPTAPPLFMPQIPTAAPARGPFPGYPGPAYSGYMINSPVPPQPPLSAGPHYRPSGLPGSRTSNVGKYRPHSEEDEEEEEDFNNIERDYFESDQSYTQFYTPDSQMIQDWSVNRPGLDNQQPMSIQPLQQRMGIPAPGYFASALRGQALQYAQGTPAPGQMKATPGPGFFSVTPAPAIVAAPIASVSLGVTITPIPGVKPSDATSSPALMAALSGQRSITTGVSKAEPVAATSSSVIPSTPASSEARVKSLFQARAVMEPKKIPGNITIYFDQHIGRATILMMNDTKEILFHHDINGLKVEPSFVPLSITWTGMKVGSQESEKVTVSLETAAVVTQLKDALQKAAVLIQSKAAAPQAVTTTMSRIHGTPSLPATTTGSQKANEDSAKTNFGGFTFSTKPTVTPVQEDKEKPKALTVKSSPAAPKEDAPKPFAGFSLTPSTAAAKPDLKFSLSPKPESSSLFSNKSPMAPSKSPGTVAKSPGAGDDDHVEEYEPNVDFKPVISLPELVEKKTGEENETEVFVERCKLFRFDIENKQWKERGVGELKILKSKDKNKFRIIMRRDQILKLCANHFITADMQLTTMAASDKAWCYSAMDFSEEEMKLEKLAVRFKNAEKASLFQTVFEDCCKSLKATEASTVSIEVSKEKAEPTQVARVDSTDSGRSSKESNKPLSELFKPKSGSWECQGCYLRNNDDVLKCPACATSKPGAQPAITPASTKPLNELFKPKAGSWECDGCLVRNGSDVVKCLACCTLKPGAKADEAPSSAPRATSFASSITGGTAGTGFKFGSANTSSAAPTTGGINFSVPATTTAPTGFKFGVVSTTAGSSASPGGFKFGVASTTAAVTTATTSSSGGFKFGTASTTSAALTTPAPAGFTFGLASATSAASSDTSASTATTASGGFKFGAPMTTSATSTTSSALGEMKFVAPSSTSASTTSASGGFLFGAPGKTVAAATATASGGFNFGSPAISTVAATTTTTPAVGGFKFGTPSTTTSTTGISFQIDSTSTPQQSGVKVTSAITTPGFTFGTQKTAVFGTPASNLFGASSLTTTTASTTTSFSFGQSASKEGPKGPDTTGLLAKLLTSEDTPSTTATKPTSGFSFTMPSKTSTPLTSGKLSSTSSTPGFQFSFSKSPVKPSQTSDGVPESPEVDEGGLYVNKEGDDSHIHFEPLVPLPEKVEVKTGEEDENILFESRSKMYRFVSGEWKEKGTGVLKILENKVTKKTRVLMRRDQVLKICCNHNIDPALSLQPMAKSEGKAWVWYALDFTEEEGQMEQLAVRFRTAEIASQFKEVFEKCRDNASSSPAKPQSDQPSHIGAKKGLFKGDDTSDDDVIFVGEDTPTQDQIVKARKYLLPDTFYLYENRAPCPGCIGCNDGELPVMDTSTVPKSSEKEESNSITPQQQPLFGAGGSLPDFSSLTSNSSSKKDGSFVFGSGTSLDFSSLASSSSDQGFTWQKVESSSPFKFAGAGQKLFGTGNTSNADKGNEGEEGDDSAVAPSDDIHFEPVIPLPDLVEVKTGEEDWTPLFCQRAKLYKFDQALGQWKERGTGDIKILAHKTKSLYRILQRREQIFKVSCNHLISVDMDLKPMATSETSWCWIANDYTESEPTVEQFAVKFKNKEIAAEFREIFLQCQEKLRQSESVRPDQEAVTAAQNFRNIVQRSLTLEVAEKDIIVPSKHSDTSAMVQLWRNMANPESVLNETFLMSQQTHLGDKGSRLHTKALDVSGQDEILPASYTPLGGQKDKPTESPMKSSSVTPLGDKGSRLHTKALDVSGQDEILPASYTPLGGQKDKPTESPMKSSSVTPLGDKGSRLHTKALDVSGQDEILPASYTPLGGLKEKPTESPMKSSSVTPLGDKGSRLHTKALDVSGQDEILPASYTPMGGLKEKPTESPMKSSSVTRLGDKGSRLHTKALDVSGQDEILPASYTPMGGLKEKPTESPMKSSSVTPLGDKGSRLHTKALDVSGQDEILPRSYTHLGGAERKPTESPMKSSSVTPLGDKGSRLHTKALDVSGQDEILPASYTHLGGLKEKPTESPMKSSSVTPLGDKGSRLHTKALDVSGQDEILPASYTHLGGLKEKSTESPMKSSSVTPLGDKGSRLHTKALDVSGQDYFSSAQFEPLREQAIHPSQGASSGCGMLFV